MVLKAFWPPCVIFEFFFFLICRPEFCLKNVSKVALICCALYGGKVLGANFWKLLGSCLAYLGFTSCKADPAIWMREAQKDDGSEYWEYVLVYMDNVPCNSMDAENLLQNESRKYFFIKPKSVGLPKIYFGNKVSEVALDNGVEAWAFIAIHSESSR